MDRSDVITLIGVSIEQDDYGVRRQIPHSREVMCQVNSVTQTEFFEAGRKGLNPEYRFTLFFADYNDETIVEYNGRQYAVYRSYYRRDDKIELYCERKGGTNKPIVSA